MCKKNYNKKNLLAKQLVSTHFSINYVTKPKKKKKYNLQTKLGSQKEYLPLNSSMKFYLENIYKDNFYVFNTNKILTSLKKMSKLVQYLNLMNLNVLYVNLDKSLAPLVRTNLRSLRKKNIKCSFCTHHWVGGFFTNNKQIFKSSKKNLYNLLLENNTSVRNTFHKKDIFDKNVDSHKMLHTLSMSEGLFDLTNNNYPEFVIFFGSSYIPTFCNKETLARNIPFISLVSAHEEPSFSDYVIPANVNSFFSVDFFFKVLKQSVTQTASIIKNFKQPDPYKHRGIKLLNEIIKKKKGKRV